MITDKVQAIVDLYADLTERGIPEPAAATMAAALIVQHELDQISDMLDAIDSRLLTAGTMNE